MNVIWVPVQNFVGGNFFLCASLRFEFRKLADANLEAKPSPSPGGDSQIIMMELALSLGGRL